MTPRNRHGGFSLVELLIGIALALILSVGLINIFINSKQAYRLQEATSRMQENGRMAVEFLSRAIRLADFWGSVTPGSISIIGTNMYDGTGDCKNGWLINPGDGLHGYQGGGSAPALLPAGCINNYVAKSDALAVRYADPDSLMVDDFGKSPPSPTYKPDLFFLRVLVGNSGVLFKASSQADAIKTPGGLRGVTGQPGAVLSYKFNPELYYLQKFTPSTTPATAPIPALYYRQAQQGTTGSVGLVPGIENMRFEYGLDMDGDLVADRYMKAPDIEMISAWNKVIAVRISLIVRGDALDRFQDNTTYTMAGGDTWKPSDYEPRFLRQQIVKEVQVRNRVRAPT